MEGTIIQVIFPVLEQTQGNKFGGFYLSLFFFCYTLF